MPTTCCLLRLGKCKTLPPPLGRFQFPKDIAERDVWLSRICWPGQEELPVNARLCSKHFCPSSISSGGTRLRLLPGAEPFQHTEQTVFTTEDGKIVTETGTLLEDVSQVRIFSESAKLLLLTA
jgi:hypothetical protein